ncbi:hybrid sensor histidine kinase/response regulator transcription factor [Zobellia galactanivorans]|uniref:hybrid sensor histidine kinase/response regulator transcription factor n=1 Tax=Zobellia galactanivorans (strain DSM 12802 / CCUG 47099 / CIP 106680 / NCIMB 13871 / Dsij) TaxID=63186 RepID=UPI001C07019E|nr:two-component regulator propeller domain-containing protein [Zobellia galactanivorans]MBU3024449.1 response regulator [Zobellia galactanivorans]
MKFHFAILILLTLFGQVQAQIPDVPANELEFKNYSTEDGLSQRSVVSIIQDTRGFLWFGTRYGLNRFDGKKFKNYYYDATNKNSLSNSWVKVLYLGPKGTVWAGTKNGLNKYNPDTDDFTRVRMPNNGDRPFEGEIFDIGAADDEHIWVSAEKGLMRINTISGEVHDFNQLHSDLELDSHTVLSVLNPKKTHLWFGNPKKVFFYDDTKKQLETYDYPSNQSPEKTKNYHTVLFKDQGGTVWLGYNGGLAYFNEITQTFSDLLDPQGALRIDSPVRTIHEENGEDLWVGTYNGLYIYNRKTKDWTLYKNNPDNPKSLSQNSIYDITADSRGDLWIGTWAGGISYLNRKSSIFKNYQIGSNGLNYPVVSSIIEDNHNNLWIGTEGGGLNYFDTSQKKFTYFTHVNSEKNSIASNNVKAMAKDRFGNLWVGTHDQGLSYASVQDDKLSFKDWNSIATPSSRPNKNRITCLFEDGHGNVWMGTDNRGLNFYDIKSGNSFRVGDPKNILGTFVSVITQPQPDGNILVGGENGLGSVSVDSREITRIAFKKESDDPYDIKKVISIYASTPTLLWIGTEGDGLYQYDLKTHKSTRYGVNSGLPDEVIYGILPDDLGHIWLSTNKGLSRLNINSGEIKNYSRADGLVNNEFNYGAHLRTQNGKLAFGGVNGFTIFDPKEIERDSFIAPVVIEKLKIADASEITIAPSTSHFELKHDENDITFDYVALDFSRPQNNKYAYKLDGFDTKWNFSGNLTRATYTNLDPGNYTFLVKASNSDGIFNGEVASLEISITPPFWKTWWAYLLYFLALGGIFLLVRRYTLIRIKERHDLRRERQEKTQMQELNRLKLQLFTNISHDFRTPLTLITAPLQRLIEEKKDDPQLHRQLSGMQRNARILLQLINQLLDFRKAENGKLKLAFSKNDIIPFVEDTKASFNELAQDKGINFVLIAPKPPLEVWFDRIEMKKVILNILSNAFKFTPPNGKISIQIEAKDDSVDILIKDTGSGINQKDIEFVFDRYFQLGQKNDLRSGTGVGLALAKDIVDLHHGKISVESELGKGSCFSISLPLGKAHLKPEDLTYDERSEENDLLDYYDPSILKSTWVKDEIETAPNLDDSKQTILVVEDNKEVRTFVKGIFNDEFNVIEANNGRMGIELAKTKNIDMIISDVMMPEMGGIEMCESLKSDVLTSHIPVILLTARTSSKIQKIGFETGADAYVTKPFEAHLLKLQVQNLLATRKKLAKKFRKDLVLEPSELKLVSTDEVFLKNAVDIVEKNLSNAELNASFLSEHINMSQSVLYRKLKALTGNTISEFIRGIRLKKAGQLLRETELNINDVAYEVGFNDIKYFRACFKKAYGKTPSAYKKQQPFDPERV